jgi:hypothetical protein
MTEFVFPTTLREGFHSALPEQSSSHGGALPLGQTYVPTQHAKALDPDVMLVEGMRGAGKSVWFSALQQPALRRWLGGAAGINEMTRVSVGFGEASQGGLFPTKDTLIGMVGKHDPRQIWKTVFYRQVVEEAAPRAFQKLTKWPERVSWVKEHSEDVDNLLFTVDDSLNRQKLHHLVLFDALDRTADDWKTMNQLVRGLLQVVLDMRPCKRLRLKVFVRPDQLADPAVRSFPDASKVLNGTAKLEWSRRDLFGLLWRYLANDAKYGSVFRTGVTKIVPKSKWAEIFETWEVPSVLNTDEDLQTKVFHAITGPWMGRDQRRGFPYSWLPSHLCDVHGKVSPRSFLAALRHAAEDPSREGYEYALHFESIKRGVQEASKIRVEELEEDFPWMSSLFKPLAGVTVPCTFAEIERVWQERQVFETLEQRVKTKTLKLPPQRLKLGASGVLEDLLELGFVEQLKDKRINLPDVYRVGYGLGRRGGVKPLKG